MLFSATLPNWVKKVARRYLKNPKTIDLVGEEQTGKLNEDVTLNVMQVSSGQLRICCNTYKQCPCAVY